MSYLDQHPQVTEWASEEFYVPYIHPVDKRTHRYFPDFWVRKRTNEGTEVLVIEVKPSNQTRVPTKDNKKQKTFINEALTYEINQAKWKAAKEFCDDHKWKFMIVTEKELGIKF